MIEEIFLEELRIIDMHIKIKRLTETAIIPEYKSSGAAAFDLHADIPIPRQMYKNDEAWLIHTGIAIQIPRGYVGVIVPRSGLGNKGLVLGNGTGIIDSDYRGEIVLSMWNRNKRADQFFNPGARIAQMLIMPVQQATFIEVDELDGTDRGSGGFGSTGK